MSSLGLLYEKRSAQSIDKSCWKSFENNSLQLKKFTKQMKNWRKIIKKVRISIATVQYFQNRFTKNYHGIKPASRFAYHKPIMVDNFYMDFKLAWCLLSSFRPLWGSFCQFSSSLKMEWNHGLPRRSKDDMYPPLRYLKQSRSRLTMVCIPLPKIKPSLL